MKHRKQNFEALTTTLMLSLISLFFMIASCKSPECMANSRNKKDFYDKAGAKIFKSNNQNKCFKF